MKFGRSTGYAEAIFISPQAQERRVWATLLPNADEMVNNFPNFEIMVSERKPVAEHIADNRLKVLALHA